MRPAKRRAFAWLLAFCLCTAPATIQGEPGWPEVRIRMLPDQAFALIETDDQGRRLRRCPHHDGSGHLDVDQLIFVIGTLDQLEWTHEASASAAEKHLRRHYDRFSAENRTRLSLGPVNINTARLRDLVRLPGIGPVLAVRIAEFRQHQARFLTLEDIMKVDGISRGTFNAIRYYIEVD